MKKQKLSDVELDEVSLVDRPANRKARIVLAKRYDGFAEDLDDVEKASNETDGLKLIIGFKPEGGSEIQSVVFDTDKWTEERAKKWLKDHKMKVGDLDKPKSGNTLRFRQHDPSEYSRFRVIIPGRHVSKALRRNSSWGAVENAVREALEDRFKSDQISGEPIAVPYIRDIWKDNVVVEHDGNLYRIPYQISYDDDGPVATLGDAVPVRLVYQDVSKNTADQASDGVQIPAENLFRIGRLAAGISQLKYRLSKAQRLTLGRMGGPLAGGPGGWCVCPKCGYKARHTTSKPCNKIRCPKCGALMVRRV